MYHWDDIPTLLLLKVKRFYGTTCYKKTNWWNEMVEFDRNIIDEIVLNGDPAVPISSGHHRDFLNVGYRLQ